MHFLGNNVKYKLGLAVFLMTGVPMLAVLSLIIIFVLPEHNNDILMSGLVLLVVIVSWAGFSMAKKIVDLGGKAKIEKTMLAGRSRRNIASGVTSFSGDYPETPDFLDKVTGLYTFIFLRDKLKEEIVQAAYYQRPCSLLVVDIDDMKTYTKKFGDAKKREMINEIVHLMQKDIPPVGKIARFDASEFGVLLPETNKKEAMEIAQTLRVQVENLELSEELDNRITVSIGVGENPIDGINENEIMNKARKNVKRAKEQGGNKIVADWTR